MVATGVADRARARVKHLVYLDAFAPKDGEAVFDLLPPDVAAKMQVGAAASASGFGIPSNPMPSDTAPEDVAWASTRRLPQPIPWQRTVGSVSSADGDALLTLRVGPVVIEPPSEVGIDVRGQRAELLGMQLTLPWMIP